MSEWEPVCEPGGSGGGFKAGWQHLTVTWDETFCGMVIDRERWKRWGLFYSSEHLNYLASIGRLCAECCRGAHRFEAGKVGA